MHSKLSVLTKWRLHRFYSRNRAIAGYLPPTALSSDGALADFLKRYKIVYIKGSTQHTGKGIVKAWQSGNGYRFIKVRGSVQTASTIQELSQKVKNANPGKALIVQKAIDLARINGRLFDIRVMMMRDGERKWNYAGMVAKVAGTSSVVSNVRRGGGYVTSVEDALRKSLNMSSERIAAVKKEMIRLSHTIMSYSEQYPFFSFQCGIDLAVDKRGRVWIIEVNLHNPSHGLFKKLNDKTYYRRIGGLYWSYRRKNKRLI